MACRDDRNKTNRVVVVAWLRSHPEIEVVSRDRGGEYAVAACRGAPQAQQFADKFHLVLNLREKLKEFLARKQKLLPQVEDPSCDAIPDNVRGVHSFPPPSLEASAEPQAKSFRKMSPHLRAAPRGAVPVPPGETNAEVSRAHRYGRYEVIHTLHCAGFSERAIARRMKLSRQTVHKFLVAEMFPERRNPLYRGSILDPYKPYILDRWQAGCWNGAQLEEEIRQHGDTGSASLFRLFIHDLRKQQQLAGTVTTLHLDASGSQVTRSSSNSLKPLPTHRMSPTRAS